MVKGTYCQRSSPWQYSQRELARVRTVSRVAISILRDKVTGGL
jgi:hypothetical protein